MIALFMKDGFPLGDAGLSNLVVLRMGGCWLCQGGVVLVAQDVHAN